MKKLSGNLDVMWKYVIFVYVLFWITVLGIFGNASIIFHVSGFTMRWLADLCAWIEITVIDTLDDMKMIGELI